MMKALDFKKTDKALYQPGCEPELVSVPEMLFLAVDGQGDPNEENGSFPKAVEALYAVTYTIKMSKMGAFVPQGYYEYTVPPLEGLWWLGDSGDTDYFSKKERYHWTVLIRQPEFVTKSVVDWAKEEVQRKKPGLDVSHLRLLRFQEGLCLQAMHIGPYDSEPETLAKMDAYMNENGLKCDIGAPLGDGLLRRHHEIYLGDPKKTKQANLKTVLRHPVKRI